VDDALKRDNCEIKILALQSLFQADPERAIRSPLKPSSANPAVSRISSSSGFDARFTRRRESVPILLDIARSNPDQKLRLTAIKRLGEQHSDQVIDELIKIYDAIEPRRFAARYCAPSLKAARRAGLRK
jgi:hypothetical protein